MVCSKTALALGGYRPRRQVTSLARILARVIVLQIRHGWLIAMHELLPLETQ
jgi:hypothetical protein